MAMHVSESIINRDSEEYKKFIEKHSQKPCVLNKDVNLNEFNQTYKPKTLLLRKRKYNRRKFY